MKIHFTYPSADGRTLIHAIRWIPDNQKPVGILQIAHGMVEFIDRYDEFARFLNRKGYVVVGNDHLGHGESVVSHHDLGHFGEVAGYKVLISDMHTLRHRTCSDYPDLPYFMLGHSMGSFLLQAYLRQYAKGLEGAIIMGTGRHNPAVLLAGRVISRIVAFLKGKRYRSKLLTGMVLGSFNKSFEPARTPVDWLSRDRAIVDAYAANPLNNFQFSASAYNHMFHAFSIAESQKTIKAIPETLPILFISGSNDPVGNFGKGVRKAYKQYKRRGMRDLTLKLIAHARHEVLNETDREQTYQYIFNWMKER